LLIVIPPKLPSISKASPPFRVASPEALGPTTFLAVCPPPCTPPITEVVDEVSDAADPYVFKVTPLPFIRDVFVGVVPVCGRVPGNPVAALGLGGFEAGLKGPLGWSGG
jgi:hypothetical protein